MSQLSTIPVLIMEADETTTSSVTLQPALQRGGVVTMAAPTDGVDIFPDNTQVSATYSVRPGKPADLINGNKRVKRKFTTKVRLPIEVPALVAGQVASVIDYIDAELTLSAPVEAELVELQNALRFFADGTAGGPMSATWVEEMYAKGYEPF